MLLKLFSLISLILVLGFTVDIVVGNTLIFGRGGDSVGLDPAHKEDGESFKVCKILRYLGSVCRRQYRYSAGSG